MDTRQARLDIPQEKRYGLPLTIAERRERNPANRWRSIDRPNKPQPHMRASDLFRRSDAVKAMKVAEFDQAFMIQVVDPANFVAPERTHPEAGPFDFRKERIRRATSLLPQGEKPSFPLELLGNVRRVSVGRQLWEVVFGLKRDPLHICGRIGGTNEAGFIHSTSVFQAEGLLDAVAMFYGIDLTTLPDTVAEKVLKTRETRMALLESRAYGAFFGKQGHYTYLDIIAAELNIGGPMKIDPSRQGVVYCGIAAGRVIDTV